MRSRIARIAWAPLVLAIIISAPYWGSRYLLLTLTLFGLYLAMAQMWNLMAGYAGLISLGQQIFVGLGGYTLAVTSVYYHWPVWLGVIAGGVVSALFALVLAIPLFRMRGLYFAVGSWAAAEALMVWFGNWDYTGRGMGLFLKPAYELSLNQIYWAAVFLGAGSTALVYGLLRSSLGLGLMAMRDDQDAAEAMGVNTVMAKLVCFIIAAFVTGVTAGVAYLNLAFIQPNTAFGMEWTIRFTFIVIIGGIGVIEGPVLGAVIFVLFQQVFAEYAGYGLILLGGFSVLVMLFMPKGVMGTIRERFGFEILSTRRKA